MGMGRILVIAGSDSSGGAGLEADQKVIAAHGCYAMTATTALTAQNTQRVHDIHYIPADFVRKQIDAVVEDIGVDVVKTGMLGSAGMVGAVATALQDHGLRTVVIDPVMVSTSKATLLKPEALKILREELLPLATVFTPNLPEARILLADAGYGHFPATGAEDLKAIAHAIRGFGPKWVLVKGGHCPFPAVSGPVDAKIVQNVLVGADSGGPVQEFVFGGPYHDSKNTHGTGCSLASAIACNLASGMAVPDAVETADRYIEAAIRLAPGFGQGAGPLNHFHSVHIMPCIPGHFVDFLLQRPEVRPLWRQFITHPFVLAMGQATLPMESFTGYLVQDYLYLVHFARANALVSVKTKSIDDIAASTAIVSSICRETQTHIKYCKTFGISKDMIESSEEKAACTAYTRYVLDIGQSEDLIGLLVAMLPCSLGYQKLAQELGEWDKTVKGPENPYWPWIESYRSEEYCKTVDAHRELIERHAVHQSPRRIEELVKIFIHATKMEIAFWEMFPAGQQVSDGIEIDEQTALAPEPLATHIEGCRE
ncbi:putative hydroxymethylpyrimidine/phosphomethylpyrimidine kinase 2 [Echria macrotheca]|uniref:Hydroxymethylpyrimidine/phosphomethylpyrimidine kinase 2 n=1 Tax=Echria macrotheca TaxID=438768 RepID=A0AAJ0F6Y7_9PEZI|nr:putative hydroxymethylpyrimidine/phosphomethylpyrimidine kinase 2 [Echria macrotheca]